MTADAWLVLAPVVGLVAYGVTHIAHNWVTHGRRLLRGFIVGLLIGVTTALGFTVCALAAQDAEPLDAAALALLNLLTFLALADGYINFVNIMIYSLRLRVLHELLVSGTGLTSAELLARYSTKSLITMRLRRLTAANQLRYADGRYYARFTALLWLGKLYRGLKLLLLKEKSTGTDPRDRH